MVSSSAEATANANSRPRASARQPADTRVVAGFRLALLRRTAGAFGEGGQPHLSRRALNPDHSRVYRMMVRDGVDIRVRARRGHG